MSSKTEFRKQYNAEARVESFNSVCDVCIKLSLTLWLKTLDIVYMWVRVHIIQYRYINTIVKGMHISKLITTYTLFLYNITILMYAIICVCI